ncbi:protein translocase subunit SecDF [Termitidicoccus mucosus]|uniref:Multifunctional fusion protein n=1 Tax=Termitidicoccus mucosus TaxID=1184151 RepID=A0A178IIF9_9BACT|nr:preprotein translocase subunit SecD [Opitutaceae bacterium TSB47]
MPKRNFWKVLLSIAVVVFFAYSMFPLKDREFVDFVKVEAQAKQSEFDALLKEAVARRDAHQAPSAFIALKQLAAERKIDLTESHFPKLNLGDVKNIEKKNAILLDHLLKESKARLQLGLDLKGGVAFTLEIAPSALENMRSDERKEKLTKAIDIIGSRINAFGVTEPIIRPVGDSRLEVQLPGVNTKDNPDVIDSLQKPALLQFRIVHPTLTPAMTGGQTPVGFERMTLEEDSRSGTHVEEIYIKRVPEADGKIMKQAFARPDQYGKPEIILQFTDEGRSRFAQVTRSIVENAQSNNLPYGRLAIVLDGKLYSAPTVREEINSPTAQITGSFTDREAQNLANVLNNPLDVPMVVMEQYEVGPSLAQDAVDSGVRASIIGTALVAAFMVTFYTTGGFVAVCTLAINVIIIFGFMARLGATLTLPGLAGIVLTIGMAVDANILIYERMREELAEGKSLASANQNGFMKALWTILDAHFVQLIVCAIMIFLGTGPIKGFGVTLCIGVISTLFSVLVVAHLTLEWMFTSGLVKKFTMRRMLKNLHVDWVRFGKPAFIASWIVVFAGLAVVIYKGNNIYGIDFRGGDAITLQYKEQIDTGKIREVAAAGNLGEVVPAYISAIGGSQEMLRIETETGKSDALFAALQKAFPQAGFVNLGTSVIGKTIGDEILYNALVAVLASMGVILLYIAFRFEFGFGIGAMFSSFHDILMAIGLFVLTGHHFSAPMVAAILAIAGYSINETVVVFDRIREELRLNPNTSLRDVVNNAISKVFARTIMTATTTFLASASLWIWGTGVLKDIAFTFTMGVLTSTFSAIFIASQVFYWWHKGDRKRVEKHQDVRPTYEWQGASKASE